MRIKYVPLVLLFVSAVVTAHAQTWTPLVNQPPEGIGLCLLLTDGGAMCQANTLYNLSNWYKLTPDASGSYHNGTWSSLASLPPGYVPLAFASAVLADGRVVLVGGEYNNLNFALTNMGAIYDPVADTWTMLAPPPSDHFQCIGDAPATVLADGRLIIGSKLYQDLAVLDPATLSWSLVTATGKTDAINSEEGWTLLPDGSFFTLDVRNAPASERFLLTGPAAGVWANAGNTPQDLHTPGLGPITAPGCPVYHPPGEVGPTLLRPDGTVFAIGADGFTGIYTPPAAGSTAAGTWIAGPSFPNLNVEDGPGAVLPSGHVLFGASSGVSGPGLQYYEFDGANLIGVPAPHNGPYDPTEATSLLILPTGEVMFVDGSTTVELYTAAASPSYDAAWAPAITNAPGSVTAGATYPISGTQFNGMGQGSAFGDESQNSTNYPLVRITNNATGHVFYARTHGHSSMGVATGTTAVSTSFDVPVLVEAGDSTIQVVANGIPSAPVAISVTLGAGVQPPTATTGAASAITGTSVTLSGSASTGGGDTQVWFEYSTDSSMAGSLSTPKQDIGSGGLLVPFTANVTGLVGNTTYYFRAWASNTIAAAHGHTENFTQTTGPNGYNGFGPNSSFSTGAYCISGQSDMGCGPAMLRQIAAPFTPGATLTLGSISVALSYVEGTNGATISLLQDAGGLPGTSLENWTVNNLPASPPALTTVYAQLNLTLQGGQQYWVAVQPLPAGSDTLLLWYTSDVDQTGAVTNNGGSGWVSLGGKSAFSVTGTPIAPAINQGGVITASAFGAFPTVAPGSWIEIYGSNLASDSREWAGSDFNGVNAPQQLDGTSVTIGGQPAFVSFISSGQVNVQAPFNIGTGPQPLVLTAPGGVSNTYTVAVDAQQGGLLAPPSFNVGGHQYVVALLPDNVTYTGLPSHPAHPGDTIILYGIGFGAVTPAIPAGQLVGTLNTLAAPFHLFFGNSEAALAYDGLAPNYVGLYQFNVVVPGVAASGLVPLTFTLAGSPGAQTLYIAVE